MNFAQFIDVFVAALYNETELRGPRQLRMGDILKSYGLDFSPSWRDALFSDYTFSSRVNAQRFLGPVDRSNVTISADGIRWVEEEIGENVAVYLEQFGVTYVGDDEPIPAADRIVSLDHNSAAYGEIAENLHAFYNEFRGANELPIAVAERTRLQKGLDAALTLWGADELKAIQIKVGVIMAIQDAATALKIVGKGIGMALLVDGIKSYVKTHIGLDLDKL